MAELVVESLPGDLRRQLELRALRNHRSTVDEIVAILEATFREEGRSVDEVLRGLPIHGSKPLTDELIHEARTTGRP